MRKWFVPNFSRFVPTWLAFGLSVGLTVLLWQMFFWVAGAQADSEDDMPPLLIIVVSIGVTFAALVVGIVLAPFRRLFLGPRFPFLRRGYLAVACAPLPVLVLPAGEFLGRARAVIELEVVILTGAFVFICLGRWFGVFDDVELSRDAAQAERISDVFS